MMPANPHATGVFSTSPACGTLLPCMRHVSCMIHVINHRFLIGTRSDLLGGLSKEL